MARAEPRGLWAALGIPHPQCARGSEAPGSGFLDLFGLNAVSDLPNLREIEDILDDPAFQKDRAKLMMTSGLGRISSDDSDVEPGEHPSINEDHAEA